MFLLPAFLPGYPSPGQERKIAEVDAVVAAITSEQLIGLAFGMRTY